MEPDFVKKYDYRTLWYDISGPYVLALLRNDAGFYKVTCGAQHSSGLDIDQALLIVRSLAHCPEKVARLESALAA